MRGLLIVFEGKDKTGKTTQAKLLVQKLNEMNIKSEYIAFPNRETEIGKLIDRYLKKDLYYSPETIRLLFSANRREMQNYIIKALLNNVHIVLDRYYVSGLVYSKVLGIDAKIDIDIGLVKPDITILLDYVYGPINCKEKYESKEFQDFLNFNQYIDHSWEIFDNNLTIDLLNTNILSLILSKIKHDSDNNIEYIK